MDGRVNMKKDDATEPTTLPFDTGVKVPKNYVPEGFESEEAFLEDMRTEFDLDIEFDRINRDQAIDDKAFCAGEQWDKKVLEYRKGLPCLVINTVPQFTAQLVGDWREGRKAVKVVPAEDGDKEIASVRGDLIRAIELQSRAQRTYDTAFESLVQCGDGAFRVSVEYAKDDVFEQDIFVRPIDDCLSVVWDRTSVDPTGRDAKHCFVNDIIPMKEFKKAWPEADPSELGTETYKKMSASGWIDTDGARVTEYWRIIERQRFLGLFEDGTSTFIDQDNYDQLLDSKGPPVRTRLAPCSYAQMHLTTGFQILSGPYEYRLDRLPIIRMSGRVVNVGGRRVRYGLVRFMKDPVRLRNFWRSVAAEQLGYAPKAQWIATESAVEGREQDIRNAHLTRDPLLVVNDEAIIGQNIQRLDPPTPQMALLNEAQVNTQDMKDVTGIHDASLGIKSNETSGRAINARQREGDIAALTYYDNGNAAVLEGGDVINQLISQVYDGTRIIRVIGEDEAVKFLKVNDPNDPNAPDLSIGNYDVALTTGTSYSTRRVEAAQAMMDAVQVWPQLIQVAGDLVAKAQDWPGAEELAERLQRTIPQQFLSEEEREEIGQAVDPETQQAMMEMQQALQELQQENAALKQDKAVDWAKVETDRYKAQTDRIKALSDHEVDAEQQSIDAIGKILDVGLTLESQKQAANAPAKKEAASGNSKSK